MLLISDIQWETEGEDPIDCGLPENIVVIGVKEKDGSGWIDKASKFFGFSIKECTSSSATNPIFRSSTAVVDISSEKTKT